MPTEPNSRFNKRQKQKPVKNPRYRYKIFFVGMVNLWGKQFNFQNLTADYQNNRLRKGEKIESIETLFSKYSVSKFAMTLKERRKKKRKINQIYNFLFDIEFLQKKTPKPEQNSLESIEKIQRDLEDFSQELACSFKECRKVLNKIEIAIKNGNLGKSQFLLRIAFGNFIGLFKVGGEADLPLKEDFSVRAQATRHLIYLNKIAYANLAFGYHYYTELQKAELLCILAQLEA